MGSLEAYMKENIDFPNSVYLWTLPYGKDINLFSFCYISTNKLYKYILILFQGHNCWLWSILSQLRDYLGIYFRCIFTLALGVPGMCRVASCCCNCHAILAGNSKLASSQWQNTGSWKGKTVNKRLTKKLKHQLPPTILWFYLQFFRPVCKQI